MDCINTSEILNSASVYKLKVHKANYKMKLLLIILSVMATDALTPNVYFKYFKKISYENYTQFFYRLHNYENSSIQFELDKHFDVIMAMQVDHKFKIAYKDTVMLRPKDNRSLLRERDLFKTSGIDDPEFKKTDSYGRLNYKYNLHFDATDILEILLKCKFGSRKIFGKFIIIVSYQTDDNVKLFNLPFPSRFDAYFKFWKNAKSFCNAGVDFRFIIIVSIFIVMLAMVILVEVICISKSRVRPLEINNRKLRTLANSFKK